MAPGKFSHAVAANTLTQGSATPGLAARRNGDAGFRRRAWPGPADGQHVALEGAEAGGQCTMACATAARSPEGALAFWAQPGSDKSYKREGVIASPFWTTSSLQVTASSL